MFYRAHTGCSDGKRPEMMVRGDFYFEEAMDLKDAEKLGDEQRRRVLGREPLKQEQLWPA